jgi:hypothetical protein
MYNPAVGGGDGVGDGGACVVDVAGRRWRCLQQRPPSTPGSRALGSLTCLKSSSSMSRKICAC